MPSVHHLFIDSMYCQLDNKKPFTHQVLLVICGYDITVQLKHVTNTVEQLNSTGKKQKKSKSKRVNLKLKIESSRRGVGLHTVHTIVGSTVWLLLEFHKQGSLASLYSH